MSEAESHFFGSFKISVTIVKEIFRQAYSNLGVFSCGNRGLWDSTRGIRQFSFFLRSFCSSSCLLLQGYSRTENQILVRNEEFRSRYFEICCFDLVLSVGTSRFSFFLFGEVRGEGGGFRCCIAIKDIYVVFSKREIRNYLPWCYLQNVHQRTSRNETMLGRCCGGDSGCSRSGPPDQQMSSQWTFLGDDFCYPPSPSPSSVPRNLMLMDLLLPFYMIDNVVLNDLLILLAL